MRHILRFVMWKKEEGKQWRQSKEGDVCLCIRYCLFTRTQKPANKRTWVTFFSPIRPSKSTHVFTEKHGHNEEGHKRM